MANIIIDNSTLSAVQRLTGTAPAPRSYDLQGDYSALENFLTSLIFYDAFYFVDDYKSEFREERQSQFSYCRAINTDLFPYDEISAHANSLTENLILDVRAGHMEPGVIKEFLENIGLYLTCAWHMRSSNYFGH